jgi:heavy metal translocating P-type ATPase
VTVADRAMVVVPDAGVLGLDERRRISVRLGAGLVGIGLLALGTVLVRVEPDQWQIGELCRFLAAAVVGIPTLVAGLRGIVTGDTRRATDQLVAIAILAAAATGDFVTATLIPLFLELGRLFEERSALGARAAIDGIRSLSARQATRVRNGVEARVDPNSLVPGDEILVRPGERIAVDGTVIDGRAAVDQSAITGESMHEDVAPGSPVFAGTIALDGLLRIQVRGTGANTVLGRVVQLLAEVERTTVPVLRLFERRAGVWLPLVLTVAATTLFFTENLSRAITVLVVSTPTALVVAGPAAVVAAMTVATRLRILIKSADFFERASDVDTLILDKTGTVTVGAPTVTEVQPADGVSEEKLFAVAAACGFGSLHPVSRAVVAEALARGIASTPPTELQERPGLGVVAVVDGQRAVLGRRALLAELGVDVGSTPDEGVSQVWVALGPQCLGRLILRDQPRGEARAALEAMRALGVGRMVLLTGDRAAAAREVGTALGMDQVIAEVLPAQKLEVVRAEQAAGHVVMMVGDGVNDALALGG